MSAGPKLYRVGYAPFTLIPGPIFTDRRQAQERARQEMKYGGYRGYALKVYRINENGRIA